MSRCAHLALGYDLYALLGDSVRSLGDLEDLDERGGLGKRFLKLNEPRPARHISINERSVPEAASSSGTSCPELE